MSRMDIGMKLEDLLAGLDPRQNTLHCAYAANSLATVARLALANESTVIDPEARSGAIEETLEIIGALMRVVIDGAEGMERDLGRGVWQPEARK